MAALRSAESGCLIIADVSGYTEYLLASELEHAQDVVADLRATVVDALQPVLRLSGLEGDAAFAYALEQDIDASMLLDTIESAYFAFRRRLRDVQRATSCPCNACMLIPTLELKFVAHHGRFVRSGHDLTGTDVILVHRLLKNGVADAFGLRGYALLTDACTEAVGLDPAALGLRRHVERYDDVGEVPGWVEDLEARWADEQERRRILIPDEDLAVEVELQLPVPPALAWELFTSPEPRRQWQGSDRVDERTAGGRRGEGTTTHCVHGTSTIVEQVLEWRPFRSYAIRSRIPRLGTVLIATELEESATGTHVRSRFSKPLGRRLIWPLVSRSFRRRLEEQAERLRELARQGPDAAREPDLVAR